MGLTRTPPPEGARLQTERYQKEEEDKGDGTVRQKKKRKGDTVRPLKCDWVTCPVVKKCFKMKKVWKDTQRCTSKLGYVITLLSSVKKENGKKKMKKNKMNLLKTDSNTVTYLRWESRQQGDRSPLSCNPGVRAFFFFGERRGNTRRERRGNTQCDNLRGFRTGWHKNLSRLE